ncbi:ParB/RepB/Spo0J family partition protein [Methylobacillus sp. Pita2]|uniref:ParB/RepB/Spo0J family partition protein n=1 Tax=Methylobacillus sp. Pita2 TaxID=3383245 RepID=UPI0038B4DDC1
MVKKLGSKLSASISKNPDPLAGRFQRLEKAEAGEGGETAVAEKVSPPAPVTAAVDEATDKSTAEHAYIPINLVDDNPYNARTIYQEHIVIERAASIAANGQTNAVTVIKLKNGRYQLIDGHYRKRALLHLGSKEILVRIVDAESPLEQYKLSFAANDHRSGQTPLDNALAWKKLIDDGICRTEEEIAHVTMVHKSWVNKILSLTYLPTTLLDLIAENPDKVSQSVAYEVVQYFRQSENNEPLTERLLRNVITEGWGKRDVEAERKRLVEKPKRTHAMSRQFKITRMTGVSGSLKDWGNGRVVLDVKIQDDEKRKKILELIKKEMDITE